MKRQEEFFWAHDEERGVSGWVLARMPHFDPVSGMALAHDLLEHTDTYPGMEGEALAFGGICYIRVEGGYFDEQAAQSPWRKPDRNRDADGLGLELAQFFMQRGGADGSWELEHTEEPPVDDKELEVFFANLVRAVSRHGQALINSPTPENVRDIRKCAVSLIPWLRRGFRKCEDFWEAKCPQDVACLFSQLEAAIDQDIARVDHQLGDRIEVQINDDLTWTLKTVEGYDEFGTLYENGEEVRPEEEDE